MNVGTLIKEDISMLLLSWYTLTFMLHTSISEGEKNKIVTLSFCILCHCVNTGLIKATVNSDVWYHLHQECDSSGFPDFLKNNFRNFSVKIRMYFSQFHAFLGFFSRYHSHSCYMMHCNIYLYTFLFQKEKKWNCDPSHFTFCSVWNTGFCVLVGWKKIDVCYHFTDIL